MGSELVSSLYYAAGWIWDTVPVRDGMASDLVWLFYFSVEGHNIYFHDGGT